MEKEKDVLLVEMKDNEGYTLKFTLRGDNVKELKDKLTEVKKEWFGDIVPTTQKTTDTYKSKQVTSSAPSNLGLCKKCGAPNKWSTNKNKPYCSNFCWKNSEKTY